MHTAKIANTVMMMALFEAESKSVVPTNTNEIHESINTASAKSLFIRMIFYF